MTELAIEYCDYIAPAGTALVRGFSFSASAPARSPREEFVAERNSQLLEKLAFAVREASEEGFEVSPRALDNFEELLSLLPVGAPLGEIYVDDDGMISMDWDRNPENQFSIMLLADSRIAFAAYFAGERVNGSYSFSSERLPARLVQAARRWINALG